MIPIFSNKHSSTSLITSKKHMDYLKREGFYPTFTPPKLVIFCYQGSFFKEVLQKFRHQQCDGCFSKLYFLTDYPSVAIADFGIGAPSIAMKLELLIEWGVKRFISIGTAGALQKHLAIGDLVVCNRAIRDEGTSHHYLPPAKYIDHHSTMNDEMVQALKELDQPFVKGTTWTTDTPFRETIDEIKQYQSEGVLTVEMEASALFAIAQIYGVELGAAFTISDTHADLDWVTDHKSPKTREGLHILLKMALKVAESAHLLNQEK